jgi:aminopeptidase N
VGYGQSSPVLLFASEEIFNSMKDVWNQYFSQGANERLAHEIAHQYFGHGIRMSKREDLWLEEALSEYMAAFFMGRAKGKAQFKYAYDFWYARSKEANPHASLYSVDHLGGDNAGRYWWDLIYCKGPVVIQAIHDKVGDKVFWTILRSFLRSFPHKVVTTEDFIGLTNYITKEDWHPFFERYVYGTEFPEKSDLKPKP